MYLGLWDSQGRATLLGACLKFRPRGCIRRQMDEEGPANAQSHAWLTVIDRDVNRMAIEKL
jgi:hypothetical protein